MNMWSLSEIDVIELIVLGVLFFIQLFYYLVIYNKINNHQKRVLTNKVEFSDEYPAVSVILYADNDSENLRKNLPHLLEQDYPEFEVIVVNDGSTQESDEVMAYMERNYGNFYHTFVPDGSRYVSRKKLGLTMGVKASKYDWLVFTDSDCYPADKGWLKAMARNFVSNTDIVLGYSGYENKRGWSAFKINFQNLFASVRHLGFALFGKPYMGIGRNMAYRKSLFFENKGYSSHLDLQKGEDDLFINEVATSKNTRVESSKESIVLITPLSQKKHWKENRLNYEYTSHFYKGGQRFWLGFETFIRLLFYIAVVSLITLSILTQHWILLMVAIVLLLIRYTTQAIIINKTATYLGEKKSYFSLPLFDLLQPFSSFKYKLLRIVTSKRKFKCK